MSSTNQLREALEAKSASFDVSISPLDDIAGTAGQRTRRSRLVGSMCVVAIAAYAVLGVVGNAGTEPTNEMFASLADEDIFSAPSQVIKTDDGWLGVVVAGDPIEEDGDVPGFGWEFSGEVYITASNDGQEWEPAQPTGLRTTDHQFAIDEHDGGYWLALAGADGPYVASTTDLVEWTVAPLPPSPEAEAAEVPDGFQRSVSRRNIVTTDAGTMVLIQYFNQPDVEALGIDPATVCGLTWSSGNMRIRSCGTTDWQTFELDLEAGQGFTHPHQFVFSADGQSFENRELPSATAQSFGFGTQNPILFDNDGSFGVLDSRLYTSTDGAQWDRIEGVLASPPAAIAARNSEILVANSRLGTSTDVVLHTADGEKVGTDLSELLEDWEQNERGSSHRLNIFGATSGEAGWFIHGAFSQAWGVWAEAINEPFTANVGVYTLSGMLPAGAAELTDADGNVVHEWETFEAEMPIRTSSARYDKDQFVFVDDNDNELVRIAIQDWYEQVDVPNGSGEPIALFSPDGVTWTVLDVAVNNVVSAAMGDGEVVLVHYGPLGPESLVVEVGAQDN